MLENGPIGVAISAVGWENYISGILRCPPSSPINHAVLLVGYTSEYWIIKNSWGTDWGQGGFIYISRNPLYNCGIGTALHSIEAVREQM
jgi:cathepsin L